MTLTDKINDKLKVNLAYHKQTIEEVTNIIGGVIQGIDDFLTDRDLKSVDGEIVVSHIVTLEGFYVFSGYLLSPIGSSIQLPSGEILEVTSNEDQYTMRQMFRIKIPEEIVESNDSDETFGYLHYFETSNNFESEDDIEQTNISFSDGKLTNSEMNDILEKMDMGVMH